MAERDKTVSLLDWYRFYHRSRNNFSARMPAHEAAEAAHFRTNKAFQKAIQKRPGTP